ncbi:MAG: class I SAM-dependent methyltransferase [Planctomycetia bacterium]|nr:class I SAM-dependent methyltransferase [Planctomycetia bacterium]
MPHLDFVTSLHKRTTRDYLGRVLEADKAECAEVALRWDRDYWDGERKHGYGGMRYDGRWRPVAEEMIAHYGLKPDASILDIGCGKGFLLHEFRQLLPDCNVAGLDISQYAIEHAMPDLHGKLTLGHAARLPYAARSFDLVVSINTLHNLYNFELHAALEEIERVSRGGRYIVVESYRNEREKVNLLYWQLTCRSFYTVPEWEWLFRRAGYAGDYSFIYFE